MFKDRKVLGEKRVEQVSQFCGLLAYQSSMMVQLYDDRTHSDIVSQAMLLRNEGPQSVTHLYTITHLLWEIACRMATIEPLGERASRSEAGWDGTVTIHIWLASSQLKIGFSHRDRAGVGRRQKPTAAPGYHETTRDIAQGTK